MTTGSASGGGWTSRRQYWGLLLALALCCSALYVLLYYRVSLASSSASLFFSGSTPHHPTSSSSSHASTRSSQDPSSNPPDLLLSLLTKRASSSSNTSDAANATKVGPAMVNSNGTSSVPLLTLFSTWVNRDDLSVVRKLTLRNWAQLRPIVLPVLFSNDSTLTAQARGYGWETMPVTRTAIGVPILKHMYLDAMRRHCAPSWNNRAHSMADARFNSTLYGFANGDILFTEGLLDSLTTILKDPALPLKEHPLLVIGQRTNVPMVTDEEALTFSNITRVAKKRGTLFTTMAEDFFITDRKFPWDNIPGVVVGRAAYDNWVVLHAIQSHHVVVDITKTAPALHQTTKAGNHEGFTHANSSYNDNVLKRLYKRIHYMGGCVDCSPWRTVRTSQGKIVVEKKATKPKHC